MESKIDRVRPYLSAKVDALFFKKKVIALI